MTFKLAWELEVGTGSFTCSVNIGIKVGSMSEIKP